MEIIYSSHYHALQAQLYRMAGQALRQNRPTLILVPAQASFLVESGILRECGVQGFLELEVMSFEKLTSRMLELEGGRVLPALDGAGVAMLAKRAMRQAQGLRALNTEDERLHQRVGELVSALKSEEIFPEQLRALAEGQQTSTADKLLDVADIFEQMLALSGGSMMDGRDQEKLVQGKFAGSAYLQKRDIIIFGFDILPALRMKSIVALAQSAASLKLLMEAADDGVLQKQWQCVKRLEALARSQGIAPVLREFQASPSGEIGFLQKSLYAYPAERYEKKPEAVEIVCAANRQKEVEYAAQRILEHTCEQGGKMREVAILAGSMGEYEAAVRDVFARAGIPFFLESKRALLESSAAEFALSALDILARRWRLADVLRHLKCGFLCDEREETALVRHAREYGLRGYAFRRGFKKDGEEIEALRQRAFGPLLELERRAEQENIAALLLEYLEQVGLGPKLEGQAEELEQLGFLAEGRYLRQVYEAMCALIGQALALGEQMDAGELRQVLEAGFEAAQISIIPPATDEVSLGDITHSIFERKKLVIVLGANEGSLPLTPDGAGLINDYEIAELRKELPAFPNKMEFDDQKAYLRRGFAAGERLVLCYHREDAPPSYLVHRLHRLFPALEEEQAESRPLRSAQASYDNLASELRALADGQQQGSELLSAYIGEEKKKLAELLPSVQFDNTPANLGRAVARGLYGPPAASVSRMERYFECSYRHFMEYGIRPEKIREFEEDAGSAGTYIHDLMDGFAQELAERKLSWAEIDDAVLQEVVDSAAEKRMEEHNRGIFREKRFAFSEKRLREEAAMAARAVRSQLAGSSVRVAASEAGFGGDIFSLPTPYGRLTLRGRIDRVDEAVSDGQAYVRVVDYKTGAKKFSLTDVYYGLNLQLLVYLMAVENYYRAHGREVFPAGGFYFEIKLPYIPEDADEQSRLSKFKMNGFILAEDSVAQSFSGQEQSMNLRIKADGLADGENTFSKEQMHALFDYTKNMILQAAAEMSEGELSLCPVADGENLPCRYCDYHAVCGFDELYRGNQVRQKQKMDKARFFREIGGESGEDGADQPPAAGC